jgi:hypothetical protein
MNILVKLHFRCFIGAAYGTFWGVTICFCMLVWNLNFFWKGHVGNFTLSTFYSATLGQLLGRHNMFLHACMKNINLGILVNLPFWRPTWHPKAHFRASLYVFSCSSENLNFCLKRDFCYLALSTLYTQTLGMFKGLTIFFACPCESLKFIKKDILIILLFQRSLNQLKACFRASPYLFCRLKQKP